MHLNLFTRAAVAGLCATVLVAPALTSAATARPAEHARAATPTITAKVTGHQVSLRGISGLHAGRAKLVVKGKGRNTITIGSLKPGYSWSAFSKDVVAGFFKNKSKAVERVYARTDVIGGLGPGQKGTIVFPHPGRYFASVIGQKGPSKPTWITVGSRTKTRTPHIDGRIVATDGPGWSGSATLPAQGTLLFKNAATSPVLHMVEMQQVVEGTTVEEVLASFQGPGPSGPPSWALQGHTSTDVMSQGRAMTVDYDLPPGQYVVLCFMPDPKMHGMPHALMGMMEMVHLG